jgi:hypothetical protein
MIWLWLGFLALVAVHLAVYRKVGSAISNRAWSTAVTVVAIVFAGFVYLMYEHAWFGATLAEPSDRPGIDALAMFVTAYGLEFLLSVDNNFVIDWRFRQYKISTPSQPNLQFWALVGSIPLRLLTLIAVVPLRRAAGVRAGAPGVDRRRPHLVQAQAALARRPHAPRDGARRVPASAGRDHSTAAPTPRQVPVPRLDPPIRSQIDADCPMSRRTAVLDHGEIARAGCCTATIAP